MKNNKKTNNKVNILKQEKGSITVLVLASLLFFLIFFVNLYLSGGNNISSQEKEIAQVQGAYDGSDTQMQIEYEQIVAGGTPIYASDVPTNGGAFSRANGKIDIEFLTGTSYEVGVANAPSLDEENMVPVKYDETSSSWVVCSQSDKDWYSYDTTSRKWANVMLRDVLVVEGVTDAKTESLANMVGKKVTTEGSMLVWIPRYAYKITYYAESDTNKTGNPVGYSDARGLVDSTGKTPTGMNSPVTSIAVRTTTDSYFRPHPAFEDGRETGYTQGEWSSKLTGIWMGKFRTTSKGTNGKITILPNKISYSNQTIGTFYIEAQDLGIANSHMTKNSEWGAMAYLTESKYGRDGTAVTQNLTNTTTGQGAYLSNTDQSTTNNVYGIYDISGGALEYIAGYVADETQSYGNSFASTDNTTNNKTESTQYATVYRKADSDNYIENYEANINKVFGDGTIEISTEGTRTTSWHSGRSCFVGIEDGENCPFFIRVGYYGDINSGSFYFDNYEGNSNYINGSFRVCFAVR